MRKTPTAETPQALHAIAAERFPLVPRAKPVCGTLQARVARVRERAHSAAQGGDEPLNRAVEAHNLAALIASDCGLPELARSLCWRQFDVFLTASSLDAGTAKIALQPLVNLARLHIRNGDGITAYRMLEDLFDAVRSGTDGVIDGRTIRFGDLIGDDGHREVIQWVWSILLTDGARALTRAGRWAEAQLAETIRSAHSSRIHHRALAAGSVHVIPHVRKRADQPEGEDVPWLTATLQISDWQIAAHRGGSSQGMPRFAPTSLSAIHLAEGSDAYLAPELTAVNPDPVALDIYGLGVLTYLLVWRGATSQCDRRRPV